MIQMRIEMYLDMPVYRALEAKAVKLSMNPVVYIREILNQAAEAMNEIPDKSSASGLKVKKIRT